MGDFYDEEAWLKCREEAYKFIKDKEETVIKEWLSKIGYTEPVGYYRNSCKREMEIYATRLGYLIGKAGINIKELETLLHEQFCGEWTVKLIEIRGGFVQV